MNLHDLYEAEGLEALKRLAAKAGTDARYLRQCAKRWRGKRPSPELALRLIAVDPRLSLEDMYAANAPEDGEEDAA